MKFQPGQNLGFTTSHLSFHQAAAFNHFPSAVLKSLHKSRTKTLRMALMDSGTASYLWHVHHLKGIILAIDDMVESLKLKLLMSMKFNNITKKIGIDLAILWQHSKHALFLKKKVFASPGIVGLLIVETIFQHVEILLFRNMLNLATTKTHLCPTFGLFSFLCRFH